MLSVNNYYTAGECSKKFRLQELQLEKGGLALERKKTISLMCRLLKERFNADEICKEVLKAIEDNYLEEWFENEWVQKDTIKKDFGVFKRFIDWFNVTYPSSTIQNIANNYVVECDVETPINKEAGVKGIKAVADLIIQDTSGKVTTFIIYFQQKRFSFAGRKVHTKVDNHIGGLIIKDKLEKIFGNGDVKLISLYTPKDKENEDSEEILEFAETSNKNSNIFNMNFSKFYIKEGDNLVFSREALRNHLWEVINTYPDKEKCDTCKYASICKVQKLASTEVKKGEIEHKAYKIPEYTESQNKAITTDSHNTVVCAGPGSGKTAVIVGRIRHLIEQGVNPENILVITFTKKAATELEDRCNSFCTVEKPAIFTLNALGYDILLNNHKTLGYRPIVATDSLKLRSLKNVVDSNPKVRGFNYNYYYGSYGLLKTMLGKFDTIEQLEEHEYDIEALKSLKKEFEEHLKSKGAISFDEQITLCIKFLNDNPNLLNIYQNIYKYVMIDEFQDVSEEQNEFAELLAKDNLFCVGDDDQQIYSFRGGSSKYMIDFKETHPDAEIITLKENFRSNSNIVAAATELIKMNTGRIDKDIVPARSSESMPTYKENGSIEDVEAIVNECISKGYSYSDICITSFKNAPLKKLSESVTFPLSNSKKFLINDPLFLMIKEILNLTLKGIGNNQSFFSVLNLINSSLADKLINSDKEIPLCEQFIQNNRIKDFSEEEYYLRLKEPSEAEEVVAKIVKGINICHEQKVVDIPKMICENFFNISEHIVIDKILEHIEYQNIKDIEKLSFMLNDMVLFEDTTKVEYDLKNEVQVMTAHDSKGKEFPVVIIWSAQDYKDDTDGRNLFYVSMTRAKDELYILKSGKDKGTMLSELKDNPYVNTIEE